MAYPSRDPYQKYLQADKQLSDKEKILESLGMVVATTPQSGLSNDGKRLVKGFLAFGGCLTLIAIFLCIMLAINSVYIEHTWFIAGDTGNYDPITSFSEAAERAGKDTSLTKISAKMVRSDGTLDLNATYSPGPEVEFSFFREVPAPNDAPPPGTNTGDGKWHQTVTLTAYKPWSYESMRSLNSGSSKSYFNLGMQKRESIPLSYRPGTVAPVPKCFFKTLWETALSKGANANAVSDIIYDSNGYTFSTFVNEKNLILRFDQNCQLIVEK